MNGKKKLPLVLAVALTFILSLTVSLNSFAAGTTPENDVPKSTRNELGTKDAYSMMSDFLNSRGWNEGENKKGNKTFYISLGVGAISADRKHDRYIVSRQNAFDKAMLNAKQNIVEFMTVEITNRMVNEYKEPSQERESARIQRLKDEGFALETVREIVNEEGGKDLASEQAVKILHREIDKELRIRGFDPSTPIAEQELQRIVAEENFKRNIQAAAVSRIAGVQAFKVFESLPPGNQGEIGVVLLQSDRLHAIANAIVAGDVSLVPSEESPGKTLLSYIPDMQQLITTFGAQVRRDENGQFAILAFAQESPISPTTSSKNAAYDKAKLQAYSNIRSFVGETVKTMSAMEKAELSQSFEDKTVETQIDESYMQSVASVAERLEITGMQVIKRWSAQHPLTGHDIAGVVVAWTPSNQHAGKDMRRKNNQLNSNISSTPARKRFDQDQDGSYSSSGASPGNDDF